MKEFAHARRALRSTLSLAVALALAPAAHAITFDFEDGGQVVWNTTVSAGTSVRASNPDARLIHPNNAALYGISANTRAWWDLEPGRALGYEPQDDA